VSEGRFASLNLGGRWGDDPERVEENLERLAEGAGFERGQLLRARQVHGDRVLAARDLGPESEADGLWHHRDHGGPSWVIGVMTADCVPILLIDEDTSCIAAVHSSALALSQPHSRSVTRSPISSMQTSFAGSRTRGLMSIW
jgi:copper oxidase (laccase) domain-containing protein